MPSATAPPSAAPSAPAASGRSARVGRTRTTIRRATRTRTLTRTPTTGRTQMRPSSRAAAATTRSRLVRPPSCGMPSRRPRLPSPKRASSGRPVSHAPMRRSRRGAPTSMAQRDPISRRVGRVGEIVSLRSREAPAVGVRLGASSAASGFATKSQEVSRMQ